MEPARPFNFWLWISVLLSIVTVSVGIFLLSQEVSETSKPAPVSQLPSPSPDPVNLTPPENIQAPEDVNVPSGTSYGVFFPGSDGVTINNSLPTIIGRVAQDPNSESFISTRFGIEKSPVSWENENFLRFLPGPVRNLTVKLDGLVIKKVYAIAQYPTVLCREVKTASDGTIRYDKETGAKIPPDIEYTSESDCYQGMSKDLPPIIFFTRPEQQLTVGKHEITVTGNGVNLGTMEFTVDTAFVSPLQSLTKIDPSDNVYSLFDTQDNCEAGYYYDTKHIRIPLPVKNNRNLFYGISFPQSKEEYGSIKRRKIQIGFDGTRYDLFFPSSSVFFGGKSFRTNTLTAYEALYLPQENLYFSDGIKAEPLKLGQYAANSGTYFEFFPVDLGGHEYRGFSLPWQTTTFSGCDG